MYQKILKGGNQLWRLNDANQIAQNLQCLYPTSAKDKLDIMHCKRVDSPDNDFKLQQNGQLTYKDGCLTRKSNTEPGDLEIKRESYFMSHINPFQ